MLYLLACTGGGALFSSWRGGDPPGPGPDESAGSGPLVGEFLYQPGQVLDFALTLPDASVAALTADPRTYVPATFAWKDESWPVQVHLKGHGSFRDLSGKAAFKIDFHRDDPTATFHGVRRLTLNNMIQDGSMLAEAGAYRLYAAMELPAPRWGYARLTVNGEPFGLYGILETADEQFLGRFESDDGNLYAGGYGGDVSPGNPDNFDLEEAGDTPPYEDLDVLCEEVGDPPAPWASVAARFDADQLLGMWAVELVIGQADGYFGRGNNFLLYDDVGADRWVMIPWGADQAFRTDMNLATECKGKLAQACLADLACTRRLGKRMDDVVETWEAIDLPGFLEAEADAIHADCEADVRTEITCRYSQYKQLDFAAARAGMLK